MVDENGPWDQSNAKVDYSLEDVKRQIAMDTSSRLRSGLYMHHENFAENGIQEPFFRIVDSEARYMCICSKNSNPEHLDETKIFSIVMFHVFIFRKCPDSRIFDSFYDSLRWNGTDSHFWFQSRF